MRIYNVIPVVLLSASQLVSLSLGCTPPVPENSTSKYPFIIKGSDDPAPWATNGFVLNHFSLNVRNLNRSLDFYAKVFGMRLIFNFRATENVSIAYMAHSHGGKNGTQYQTVSELNRNKNNMEGLLELIHWNNPNNYLPATTEVSNTFSHLGMIVPDILATQTWLENVNATILKKSGVLPTQDVMVQLAKAYGFGRVYELRPSEADAIFDALLKQVPGSIDIIFVLDPDGNFIEVQPQAMPQLPL